MASALGLRADCLRNYLIADRLRTGETLMLFHSWLRTLRTVLTRCGIEGKPARAPHGQKVRGFRLGLEVLEDRLAPATFTVPVSNADPEVAPIYNGEALQEVLRLANANPGPDTIVLPAGLYLTHAGYGAVFEYGVIREDLTITGAGASRTVLSGGETRVFAVFGCDVNISGLTIANSGSNSVTPGTLVNRGAGVLNLGGTITLSNCDLVGNTAEGPHHEPSQGGAIWNDGILNIDHCNLLGNSASSGGGIYNSGGTVTIRNSTLSGNSATSGSGGAITTIGGSLTMNNCTLNNNSAYRYGGGIYVDPAVVTVFACTFSDNAAPSGADLYNFDGDVSLIANSISDIYNDIGTVTDPIANLLTQVAALNLNSGQTNSLTSTLQAAQASLSSANTTAAVNQLTAFINQLNALVNSHRLGQLTADSLIHEVDNLAELIG
jgi:hypothetical protein